ncbi:TonB-dependent receptor domain-containing protein [Mucilaginibacter sp. AW1-3]
MRYLITLFIIFTTFTIRVNAQNTTGKGKITGKVTDAVTKQPVDYATIGIYKQGSTSPVNGTTTDPKGNFTINGLPFGEYHIAVDFLGYQRFTADHIIISAAHPSFALNNIALTSSQKLLKDVNITAQASTVENKIDKLVYNVGNDLTAQGGVATDILKKVPMVTVDIDGNVELLGNPSIKFLINGKPSSIFGASLADALQSIPASQIKSIEVVTSPGAKYDASGTGGIINIILKDNKVQGYNGSINASIGTRLQNATINLNARKTNFGVNAYFSGNKTLRSQAFSTKDRISTYNDTIRRQLQDAVGYIERGGFHSGLGIDWNLSKHDNLTAGINYHHFSNSTDGTTNQQDQSFKTGFSPFADLHSVRNASSQFGEDAIDLNFGYKKTFAKDGQELDIQYTGSFNKNNGNFYQKSDYVNSAIPSTGSMGNNPGKDHETEIAIDYAHPVTDDFTIETGGKLYFEDINSTSNVNTYNAAKNDFIYDALQSNHFTYGRNVYSYYVSTSFKAFNFFDIKAGLRDEYTTTTVGGQGGVIPDYNFLSPSIILSHKITKNQTVKIGYSKRIERPDFGDMNPFVNSADPYNVSFGNPNLHPEIGNNFELGYNRSFAQGGNINITTFYRHNGFDVKQYTIPYKTYREGDSTYNNVYVTTRANVGSEVRVGVNFSASLPVTRDLTIRPNFLFATRRIMDNLPNTPSFVAGYEYRLNLNMAYQFSNDFSAEAFANYNSPNVGLQGKNSSFVSYSFAARKQFMNKKASIGFTTNVPFNDYINQSSTLVQPGNSQYSLRRVPYRSFGISFSYRFGKLEFKKDEEKDNNPGAPQPIEP